MKKWFPALAVLLGASASFAAPTNKLACANEFQQTLEIVRDAELATVASMLTSNGVEQSLDGAILPTGKFDMKPTAANEPVSLALVRPRDHGGRCGRCAIDDLPTPLYAQLVIGSSGYTFTCQQKEF